MKNYYICECGKEFNNPQSFNGHKCHCKIHLGEERYNKNKRSVVEKGKRGAKASHYKSIERKRLLLDKWVSEKHICEHCGKIMTEKYGSGKFCCRACANSRVKTEKVKKQLSEKARGRRNNYLINKSNKSRITYYNNPRYCKICGQIISYGKRYRNTCSDECEHTYRSNKAELMHKEGRNKGWIKRNIISYPESIWKDILTKNNISFIQQFKIVNHEKKKYYFLDFLINDKIDLEIDGNQHNLQESIARDIERDTFVKSLGYIVYRIPWKGLRDKNILENQIKELIKFINNQSVV